MILLWPTYLTASSPSPSCPPSCNHLIFFLLLSFAEFISALQLCVCCFLCLQCPVAGFFLSQGQVSAQMPPLQESLPWLSNLELALSHSHPDIFSSQHTPQPNLSDYLFTCCIACPLTKMWESVGQGHYLFCSPGSRSGVYLLVKCMDRWTDEWIN